MRTKSFASRRYRCSWAMMGKRVMPLVALDIRMVNHAVAALAALDMNLEPTVMLPQPANNVAIVPLLHLHLQLQAL